MQRISVDPNTLQAPDYTSAQLSAPRDALKAALPTLTDEDAAAALLSAWQASHAQKLVEWAAQIGADTLQRDAVRQREDDERAERDARHAKEVADAQDDDRKKNRKKFLPLVPRMKTGMLARIPLPYATRRLEKGEWVQMWFFTPEGFKAASTANGRGDDDPMTLTRNEDGSLSTATNVRAPKGTVADKDLSFEFFCLASVNMLDAMKSTGWAGERIAMFASFWSEIQEHTLRYSGEELDRRVLLLYQEEERLRWHHTVASASEAPYNMAHVDAEILVEVKDRLYAADRERRFQLQLNVRLLKSINYIEERH